MENNIYLELFKDIANQINAETNVVFGTSKAKKEIERGAFGDITVYIDKIAEDIVIKNIKDSNLKCSLLSEEAGFVNFGSKLPIIIVDPIDGSLNAKRGIPYFSFSAALSNGFTTDDIVLGYVMNLANKDEFYALKNLGAYYNKKRFTTNSEDINIVGVEGFKKNSDFEFIKFVFSNFNKVRQMGSMALDLCYLATGAFDLFLNVIPSRIIDYAAAKLILEEAGGNTYKWINSRRFTADISKNTGDLFYSLSNAKLVNDFLTFVQDKI